MITNRWEIWLRRWIDVWMFQIVTIRLSYKLKWKESRMIVNESIDWSRGEINISPENIQVKYIFSSDTATADDINLTQQFFLFFLILSISGSQMWLFMTWWCSVNLRFSMKLLLWKYSTIRWSTTRSGQHQHLQSFHAFKVK